MIIRCLYWRENTNTSKREIQFWNLYYFWQNHLSSECLHDSYHIMVIKLSLQKRPWETFPTIFFPGACTCVWRPERWHVCCGSSNPLSAIPFCRKTWPKSSGGLCMTEGEWSESEGRRVCVKMKCGGAVANRLRRRTSDQTVLGSNPAGAVAAALSPWTRLFTPIVPRRSLHISFY